MQDPASIIPGKIVCDQTLLRDKLGKIKAILFDWDGVFNSGTKQGDGSSDFNEVDSMGSNLLRYSFFVRDGAVPLTGVISGERNASAFYFSQREHFDYSFYKLPNNKLDALNLICGKHKLQPHEFLYFFDDVLDLSIAEVCGVRVLVNQKVNPLFVDYCIRHQLVDYLTFASGGQFAVREASEFIIAMNGHYDEIITNRKNAVQNYRDYLKQRQSVITRFFTAINGEVKESLPT